MNEELCCITNKGKTAKNERKMMTLTFFLSALYSVYKKFFFCIKSYKNLLSIKIIKILVKYKNNDFLKILCICTWSL